MDKIYEVLRYFPILIQSEIKIFLESNNKYFNQLQEIRIRINRPIILKLEKQEKILKYIVTQKDILEIFQKICENSVYTYTNQICKGFITIKGGHRVGIVGTAVIESGKVINIKYISSLNFRIAREIKDCSKSIINEIINYKSNTIFNCLIVSPPGCGKTTILRDLIRNLSNGTTNFDGQTVAIVDERGEIAANFRGIPQNDIGIRTDVIEDISKCDGMKILIRTMAPQIIACDEIGTKEDIEAINYAITSGVKGIFTAHGSSIQDLKRKEEFFDFLNKRIIEKIIFLSKEKLGQAEKIYYLNNNYEYYEKQF